MRKEKGTFCIFGDPGKENETREKERKEKGRRNQTKKLISFGEKKGDLAFQRVHTLKSPLRVKLGA